MRKKSTSGITESQKGRQVVYHRGNQKEGSPNYVFLYSDDDQSEDEEHFPLKTKKDFQTIPRQVEVINVQVQSEDTLQALALRYHCTISELKRINNIHKDNEIHAHCSIKVPVKPYSLLTETVGQSSESNQSFDSVTSINNETEESTSRENQIINFLTNPVSESSSAAEINSIILNSTVEPLQYYDEPSQYTETTETDELINFIDHNRTNTSDSFVNTFKCSGADWGLSWFQLLCFSLILGFAGPIIYILYIAESKHHNSPS